MIIINKKWNDKWTWAGNNIGAEGARLISEGLKINSTMTRLDLYSDDDKEYMK